MATKKKNDQTGIIVIGLGAVALGYYLMNKDGSTTPPTGDCTAGQVKSTACPNGTSVIEYQCVNGKWASTGQTCSGTVLPNVGVDITSPSQNDVWSTLLPQQCKAKIINYDSVSHKVYAGMTLLSDEPATTVYEDYPVLEVNLPAHGVVEVSWTFWALSLWNIVNHKIVVSAWDIYPVTGCENKTCHRLGTDEVHFRMTVSGL